MPQKQSFELESAVDFTTFFLKEADLFRVVDSNYEIAYYGKVKNKTKLDTKKLNIKFE